MKTLFVSILFILSMINKCDDTDQKLTVKEIRYGTSFGMCFGYCYKEIVFTSDQVKKILIPQRDKELKEKSCNEDYDDFEKLVSNIDLKSFSELPETIGCPDCADGGAEWIEIITPEGSKKVTYEFGNDPSEVSSFIGELKSYFKSLGECD